MKGNCSTTRFLDVVILAAMLCMAVGLPVTSGAGENGQHRRQLLRDAYQHPSTFSSRAAASGYIPTNTLAFRDYALNDMLAQANQVNARWQLGLSTPITSDHVTRLAATAGTLGMQGGITVTNRYYFGFKDGAFSGYHDDLCWWQGVERDSPRLDQLAKQRSLITTEEATKIASEAFRSLGFVPRLFALMDKPFTEQFQNDTKDDKQLPLPLFLVQWKASPKAQFGSIRIEVSGLTKKIVNYENYHPPARPLPTNYFQMLGVSPRRNEWGRQFGYDPLNTDEFQGYARQVAVEQVNRLIKTWRLATPEVSTNDLTWFMASPGSNTFDFSANFGGKFYLQTIEGKINLFKDMTHNLESMTEDIAAASTKTDLLNLRVAEQLARDALHQLGLNEKQLQLVEPPTVKQWALTADGREDGPVYKLPLYDVMWFFPEKDRKKYGEGTAAIAFQVSGVTKRVTMFAGSCPLMPRLLLPTNYYALIGSPEGSNSASGTKQKQ